MTNYETLEIIYEDLMNELHEISVDWRFETAKSGYADRHKMIREMVECIDDMMKKEKTES